MDGFAFRVDPANAPAFRALWRQAHQLVVRDQPQYRRNYLTEGRQWLHVIYRVIFWLIYAHGFILIPDAPTAVCFRPTPTFGFRIIGPVLSSTSAVVSTPVPKVGPSFHRRTATSVHLVGLESDHGGYRCHTVVVI